MILRSISNLRFSDLWHQSCREHVCERLDVKTHFIGWKKILQILNIKTNQWSYFPETKIRAPFPCLSLFTTIVLFIKNKIFTYSRKSFVWFVNIVFDIIPLKFAFLNYRILQKTTICSWNVLCDTMYFCC